jgi:hypothetical protein
MLKFVLSTLLMLNFALPATAEEANCNGTSTQPSAELVQLVAGHYPDLTADQAVTITKNFDSLFELQKQKNSDALSEADRTFAGRAEALITSLTGVQLYAFKMLPQMQSIVERMQAEEAAGLKKVSSELKPEVRRVALMGVALSLTMGELVNEMVELEIDRALVAADAGNFTDTADALERTMCVAKAGWNVLEGVAELLPNVAQLAYIENMIY